MNRRAAPGEAGDAERDRLDVHLRELESLKTEQVQRIGFRDNMLYVTLGVIGALAAFALDSDKDSANRGLHPFALLVIPWVGVILGWTYVVNDEKISAIGQYIKKPGGLGDRIHAIVGGDRGAILGWEHAHTSDRGRTARKASQLIVDLTTFVVSGFVAMGVFVNLSAASGAPSREAVSPAMWIFMSVEAALLCALGAWIIGYSGLRSAPARQSLDAPHAPRAPHALNADSTPEVRLERRSK